MDLPLYLRVIWRFRVLVALGVCIALALALLTVVRPSFSRPHLAYRQSEQYLSEARVLVTQQGFPEGYANPPTAPTQPDVATEASRLGTKEFADPTRFPTLAVLYAYLATSDPVRRIMLRSGPIDGKIVAQPVVVTQAGYGTTLPLIAIDATSTSPQRAESLAIRTTDAFRRYLLAQQNDNLIPVQNRVVLEVYNQADAPQLVKGRSKTLPLVVFITVITAVVGLAFLLENMRPRIRPVVADEVTRLPNQADSRSA